MDHARNNNPWLGLESYNEGEILYGRDDDIRDLIQCVINDADTLLYGKSGIGKSSILKAGIFPAARRYGYIPVWVRLSHKEDKDYLGQLKESIAEAMGVTLDQAYRQGFIRKVLEAKNSAHESIYEFFHRHTFHNAEGERVKLLLVFDQFEEIFTLQDNEPLKKKFFSEIADVLNDIMPDSLQQSDGNAVNDTPQTVNIDNDNIDDIFDDIDLGISSALPQYVNDNTIHFVFTIREDFLSEFEYYTAPIPSLKQNRYGLRPINEEQAAQIILRPRPGLIDINVAKIIIEKVTGRNDFELDGIPEIEVDSAVLSLYLNRLYDANTGSTITTSLVEQKGGEIIHNFYIDAISSVTEHTTEYLEDNLLNGQGRRDNITIYDAINSGGITVKELNTLCEEKKILRKFNYAGVLRIEYIHDILCSVIKQHKEDREQKKLIEAEHRRQEEEKNHILAVAKAKAEQAKKRNRRILTWTFSIIAGITIIGLGVFGYIYHDRIGEQSAYYSDFTLENGWPVGVGQELQKSQREITPLYYRLSKKGAGSPHYTDVEAMSSTGSLSNTPKFEIFGIKRASYTDPVALAFEEDLSKVVSLKFTRNEDGAVEHINALDKNSAPVFILSFFHVNNSPNEIAWVNFLQPDGRMKPLSQNGVDRIYVVYDSLRRIDSYMYYDNQRIRTDLNHVFGHKFLYDGSNGSNTVVDIPLDKFGMPFFHSGANAMATTIAGDSIITHYRYYTPNGNFNDYANALNDHGIWKKVVTSSSAAYYNDTDNPQQYIRATIDRDRYGRVTSVRLNSDIPPAGIPTIHEFEYSTQGNDLVREEKLKADGKTLWQSSRDSISKAIYTYDSDGSRTNTELYTPTGRIYIKRHTATANATVDETENRLTIPAQPYKMKIDSINGNYTYSVFYGKDRQPINETIFFMEGYEQPVHKIVTRVDSSEVYTDYYIVDNSGEIVPVTYDEQNGYIRSVSSKYEAFDSQGNIIKLRLFDLEGNIHKSMMYGYKDGHRVSRSAMGIDDTPVRAPEWEQDAFGYYSIQLLLNDRNVLVGIRPVDEFMDNSIFYDPYPSGHKSNYTQWVSHKAFLPDNVLYQVSDSIKVNANRASTTPEYIYYFADATDISHYTVPYLHLTSKESPLYAAGMKDGDRIIGLDYWKYNPSLTGFDVAWESLSKAGHHTVKVLRPQSDSLAVMSFDISIKAPGNNLHARTYNYSLTNTELNRFKQALKQ
ncbi:MAG: ATP-binding protein [Clostridiales bacterium]|nr:ATP-binding protein [Clostridiales bacterium]